VTGTYRLVVPTSVRRRIARMRVRHGWVVIAEQPSDDEHPERLAMLPFVRGRCLEVGCGHRKIAPQVIGVDLNPAGSLGAVGNASGCVSQADVAADGGSLPFRSRTFDSLIARHNLEHYVDTVATLVEWRRVLVPGGMLAVVVPDEARYEGRTLDLDPTHFHAFTETSLRRLGELIGGFEVVSAGPVIPQWSFMLVASVRP
jgi:SAM-dependent methyltransferase